MIFFFKKEEVSFLRKLCTETGNGDYTLFRQLTTQIRRTIIMY
jgi:hypothetical protein